MSDAVILAIVVYPSEWPKRWPELIHFSFTILLTKRKYLALTPLYLGSLFFRLDECVKNIVRSNRRYHVVIQTDMACFQVFL